MITDPQDFKIAVVGLGYVGLPVAVAVAERFPHTLGFDVDAAKVQRLNEGIDRTSEVDADRLRACGLRCVSDPGQIAHANIYIVAVPTPIDAANRPDLTALRKASQTVGRVLSRGDIVIYESTVYPGATRNICGPELEQASGLRCGEDFHLGYSPERINPGDTKHRLESIVKVVAGQDEATLDVVAKLYGAVVTAGVHRASSLEVAEAAKVIENVQRDLNIALMNELALIFDRLHLDTQEVLAAAGTKWNFLRFHPGLVGGHCIGVDPYYLTHCAAQAGIDPQVILAGRRINDGMATFVAQRCLQELSLLGIALQGAQVAVLGLTFKENVPDLRNSKVADVVAELQRWGVVPRVLDPLADHDEAHEEYGIELVSQEALAECAAVILAVPHRGLDEVALELLRGGARVLLDLRGVVARDAIPNDVRVWRL